MTRVIHTGDTHIGYRQYNSPERRRDFLRAFRQVAEDAVADDVDAVVHAGDLFHDRRPGLVDLQGAIEVLRTLSAAEIPFLAVVGNHESKRDAQWLDLFADLGLATRLGDEPKLIGDVAFYGLDFVPRSRRDDLEYEFESRPDRANHAVLVSHGLFEPFAHADWDTETVLAEATVDFDAMLLGDNHTPGVTEVSGAWVTYCGSTERASATERDDRGYNLVSFDDDVAISRRGLDRTRQFAFVDVELATNEGLDRVRERVREHDLEDAVVIVTIDGDGDALTPAAVEEFALERGALVARANDRREIADDDREVSVTFADPDEAVRERIRELGLSDAARDIDRTVRDVDDVADTNVRDTIERRVRAILESDDPAFEPATDRPETPDDTQLVDVDSKPTDRAEATDDECSESEEEGDDVTVSDDGHDGEHRSGGEDDRLAKPDDGSEAEDGQVSIGDFS